ncbi:BCAS3 domain-containing protein [Forsythia ovata]|uniref:BCAS3 domain-containing protein n=1 Tax=Forsythia ovata TaxID=205694 RepID=A0ABD1S5F4_9LAMI
MGGSSEVGLVVGNKVGLLGRKGINWIGRGVQSLEVVVFSPRLNEAIDLTEAPNQYEEHTAEVPRYFLLANSHPQTTIITSATTLVAELSRQPRLVAEVARQPAWLPAGTLLVTASVHGNNINIFRIMPSQMRSESGCHDWSTSYVHLYKLHRGITTAVIQDICFSHDNQWIAIVSSKGTCHIFVISPFGGDTGIQALHSHIQGSILYPDSSPPWWPTSSFAVNEKCSSPPPPCTLSVVSRIKSSDSGLLNSVM